mmetsp:Transcript_107987/g.306119  ORF Transcript_107987/g.306119 Transcript_107987/m.306119 type:complete len:285 (-) Transcript_107987:834-1688(-)
MLTAAKAASSRSSSPERSACVRLSLAASVAGAAAASPALFASPLSLARKWRRQAAARVRLVAQAPEVRDIAPLPEAPRTHAWPEHRTTPGRSGGCGGKSGVFPLLHSMTWPRLPGAFWSWNHLNPRCLKSASTPLSIWRPLSPCWYHRVVRIDTIGSRVNIFRFTASSASSNQDRSVSERCSSCPKTMLALLSLNTANPSGLSGPAPPSLRSQNHSSAPAPSSCSSGSRPCHCSSVANSCGSARATYCSNTPPMDSLVLPTGLIVKCPGSSGGGPAAGAAWGAA